MPSENLSRREWLRGISAPAVGASFGQLALSQSATSTDAASNGTRIYNVRDFGAKGDGEALDTRAVQAAIDACARDAGGTVLVPAGTFQIGTVALKSNVTLHLAASATLLGTSDGAQYYAVDAIPLRGDSTLGDGNWALIFAVDAKNIGIEGPGLIDGQGIQFHAPGQRIPPPSGLGGNRRPYHLLFHRCEHLRVAGLRLWNSAYHSVRVIQSKYVRMDGLHIYNRVNNNNDGFHFISCENVAVSNCTVESQDDACALFGSCKAVTVTNCMFSTRWSVFRFGGGTAENISVSNCVMHQVFGCPFKFHGSNGSRFENMSFSNIVVQDVTGPISISAGGSSIVRNIAFSNVHGTVTTNPPPLPGYPFTSAYRPGEGHSCIVLNAVDGAVVENVSFSDVNLTFGGGGTAEEAARRDLPRIAGEYFMLGPMPAYAMYARGARGVTLQNVRFQVSEAELRPAVIFHGVDDAAVNGLSVQADARAESALRFIDTTHVLVTAPRLLSDAAVFLRLEGAGNAGIVIDGGDMSRAKQPLAFAGGATAAAVKLRG